MSAYVGIESRNYQCRGKGYKGVRLKGLSKNSLDPNVIWKFK